MAPPESVEAPRKLFSVDDANKALPLVRAIVADIVEQYQRVDDLRRRLQVFTTRPRSSKSKADDLYTEERKHSESVLEAEEVKLREFVEELERLGVELKGPDGLCDFPSLLEGRPIYLCWRLGEPEVLYWHDRQSGYAGRQPLKPRRPGPPTSE